MPLKPILRNDASIYDLLTDGGLTWRDGKRYLNDPDSGIVMGGGGANDARVMFKEYYEVHKAQGKSDDLFMRQSFFDAQAGQAVWLGHAGSATDRCQSRSVVRIPQGAFMQTKSAVLAFGKLIGHGPSQFWTNGNNLDKWSGTKAQGGTELIVDHAKWSGSQTDNQIQGSTWGLEGFYGYQESFGIGNLFLNGAKRGFTYDPNRQIGGVGAFDAGSASDPFASDGPVQAKNHEGPSMTFARGTPMFAGRIVAMYSNTCAVDLVGDGIFHFQNIEVDATPSVFRLRGGFGRKAGGVLLCDFVKIEDGHDEHPNSLRPIDTSTALVDMIEPGWVDLLFNVVAGSSKVFNADLMRLNCPLGNNTSSVRVNLLREFGGIHCLVHDVANKKAWNTDHGTNYSASFQTRIKSFTWHNWNNGELFTGQGEFQPVAVSRPNSWRLDGQKQDPMTGNVPQWNDQAGTPKYDFVPEGGTPAPSAPVVNSFTATPSSLTGAGSVVLAWNCSNATKVNIAGIATDFPSTGSTTVNVTATTSWTLTATNANGSTQATVTVTVTAAGGAKWTSPWPVPLTMIPTTHFPIPSVVATQVVLTDFTPSALNYLRIVGTGTESLQLWPDGKFRWGNTVCAVSPAGAMVVGKKVTVTITLPSAKTLTDAWQVSQGQGGAQTGTCGTMTLK